MAELQQLKQMFPELDTSILQSVLSQKKNNVQEAIDSLLAFNSSTLSEKEKLKAKEDSFSSVLNKVVQMVNDSHVKKLADKHGLAVTNISWEDSSRNKNSSWGPCISDMTLVVHNHALPLLRYPNFEDLSWDVSLDKIPLVVGNELVKGGSKLYNVSLKEYLEHFKLYLSYPDKWTSSTSSLLAPERDSHAIMTSQACFLPVPAGQEATFNVSLLNYQSSVNNPAVLAIVATRQGTSAQIIEGDSFSGAQKLYFNKAGQKASFIGQRLSDDRKQRGVETKGEMTREEKQQNAIVIIQVPLKQKQIYRRKYYNSEDSDDIAFSCVSKEAVKRSSSRQEKADVEDAIVRVGEAEGEFKEIGGLPIERDHRYPIRVTIQYYKSTSNGVVEEEHIRKISQQFEEAQKKGDGNFIGSLVVGGNTGRPTESVKEVKNPIPAWWSSFWLSYANSIPLTEDEAKTRIFQSSQGNRISNASLSEVKDEILSLLIPSQPLSSNLVFFD